jgi:hypothetical protein
MEDISDSLAKDAPLANHMQKSKKTGSHRNDLALNAWLKRIRPIFSFLDQRMAPIE